MFNSRLMLTHLQGTIERSQRQYGNLNEGERKETRRNIRKGMAPGEALIRAKSKAATKAEKGSEHLRGAHKREVEAAKKINPKGAAAKAYVREKLRKADVLRALADIMAEREPKVEPG